jgi:hypothetical protein
MKLATRIAYRYFLGSRLTISTGKEIPQFTQALGKLKLKARSQGDFEGALLQAGYYAKKQNKLMFVYQGNSFMHSVWRVALKPSDYLNPINNTGSKVYSVSPDLTVMAYEVSRAVESKTAFRQFFGSTEQNPK